MGPFFIKIVNLRTNSTEGENLFGDMGYLDHTFYRFNGEKWEFAYRISDNGKCPKDGRRNRPIYIIVNNKRTLAVADGEGHAYRVYGEGYDVYNSKCLLENRYDPSTYEFDKGLSGMDF